ncbi:hypothetical protein [Deinococcus sp. AJ005]|uniref:hypothetical protein n=1 Tax=Deinococcus sp. AJ005 TaxID=2652443 RepID=UPI00125CCCA4|nr:hypothetical protein [Deinococcus sp. AJ005]QFP78615.1 hypothetical protein DAAJ005_18765 [Deinococcus sp. AJ005]
MSLTLRSSRLTARLPNMQFKLTTLLALPLTVAVIWSWMNPQPSAQDIQARQQALRECSEAISTQQLAGHRLDGFRVLPSTVVQTGTVQTGIKVTADYAVREGGPAGWNSGDVIRVRCQVQGGQAQLHQVASPR